MQFNSNADDQDIVSEVLRIADTSTNSYPLNDITRRCNTALDRFWFLALTSNGLWQVDDLNNSSNLPVGTTNVVSGQYDYSLASDVLLIEKVLCKDSGGTWQELTPVDVTDSRQEAKNIWTRPSSNSGSPTRYDLVANSLLLDPVPNYNSTNGLKVVFQRGPSYFDTDDNTKTPGIPIIFHTYIARYAALQFLIEKKLPAAGSIASLVAEDEKAIGEWYAFRNKATRTRLTVRQEDNR
jgi:hypothetical protein